jgi:O-antigen/teichoic acid export membrane protein
MTDSQQQAPPGAEPPDQDNSARFRRALSWAVVMTWSQRGFAILFTVLVAAIVGPHDFGVVAMALVYIGFAELFAEQGVATAIVQRPELDRRHLDTAFWINLVWCFALAGLSVAVSGWWARVNGVPELELVIDVLAIGLVIWGLTTVQQALLEREFQFRKLAIRGGVATFVSGAIGLGFALAGAGVWALVAQQLSLRAVSVLLFFALSQWRPGFRVSTRHAREFFGFSFHVLFADVAGFFHRRADALLVGLFFGPTMVGIYRLADRFVDTLLELTTRPLGVVSLPHFSRLQHDREALERSVTSILRLTLALTVPAMLVLAACSRPLLGVVGSDWVVGADALRLLAVIGIVKALIAFTGPLLFAIARPGFRAMSLWLQAALSAGVVVAAGLAARHFSLSDQLATVAGARALLFVLVFVPLNLLIVRWMVGVRLRDLASALPGPVAAGSAGFLAGLAVERSGLLDGVSPAVALVVTGTVAFAAALAMLLLLERALRVELLKRLRRLRARSSRVSAERAGGAISS